MPLGYCSVVYRTFEYNCTAAFYLCVCRTFKQYRITQICGLIPSFVLIKGHSRSQIFSYTLFDLTESNQFKFIFTVNNGGNVWLLLSDLTEQYEVFTKLRLLYPYFIRVFGRKITIYCLSFAEHIDVFIAVYRMT